MKIATYNVNGVNGRLPVLLRWLEASQPDVACLQELKAPEEKFPQDSLEAAGYGAVWHGQKSLNGVAILARGLQPSETQRGLPGDPNDTHSRYIEAEIKGKTERLSAISKEMTANLQTWERTQKDYKVIFDRIEAVKKRLVEMCAAGDQAKDPFAVRLCVGAGWGCGACA